MCTYKFVVGLYMLCDVLHTVAKLQASLQSKTLNLAAIPMLVQGTVARLMEIKEDVSSTTWFKDHTAVFTDPGELGTRNSTVTETEQDNFLQNIYRPYIQSVVDHISSRLRYCFLFLRVRSIKLTRFRGHTLFIWSRKNFSPN